MGWASRLGKDHHKTAGRHPGEAKVRKGRSQRDVKIADGDRPRSSIPPGTRGGPVRRGCRGHREGKAGTQGMKRSVRHLQPGEMERESRFCSPERFLGQEELYEPQDNTASKGM